MIKGEEDPLKKKVNRKEWVLPLYAFERQENVPRRAISNDWEAKNERKKMKKLSKNEPLNRY